MFNSLQTLKAASAVVPDPAKKSIKNPPLKIEIFIIFSISGVGLGLLKGLEPNNAFSSSAAFALFDTSVQIDSTTEPLCSVKNNLRYRLSPTLINLTLSD